MATVSDVRLERELQLDFIDEIYAMPGGEKVKDCIQCGTCSGSCPASFKMQHTPRQIFANIRAGMREDVLASDTIWLCASCYSCAVRCPKEIKIADLFYSLKRIAIREGHGKKHKGAVLSNSFVSIINRYGRNSEVRLLVRYFLKADPFAALKQAPIGLKLLGKGRLPFGVKKIKGIKQLRKIISKSDEIRTNGGVG